MKVDIGPYVTWFGPHQIADLGRFVGMSEEQTFRLGKYLRTTWVGKLCERIYKNTDRKVKVRIDKYDTWNADHTLALVIYPMLLKFSEEREHFACNVEDEDVPDELKSTVLPAPDKYDVDGNYFARSQWLLDELLWTFKTLSSDDPDNTDEFTSGKADMVWNGPDENGNYEFVSMGGDYKFDREASQKHQARIYNGLRLFGKYYRGLWT